MLSDELFEKLEKDFHKCLDSKLEAETLPALMTLEESLIEVEAYSEMAKSYPTVFIEMFQFETISELSIWKRVPKLYAAIGEFIYKRSTHEDDFRVRVKRLNLGCTLRLVD